MKLEQNTFISPTTITVYSRLYINTQLSTNPHCNSQIDYKRNYRNWDKCRSPFRPPVSLLPYRMVNNSFSLSCHQFKQAILIRIITSYSCKFKLVWCTLFCHFNLHLETLFKPELIVVYSFACWLLKSFRSIVILPHLIYKVTCYLTLLKWENLFGCDWFWWFKAVQHMKDISFCLMYCIWLKALYFVGLKMR